MIKRALSAPFMNYKIPQKVKFLFGVIQVGILKILPYKKKMSSIFFVLKEVKFFLEDKKKMTF